MSKTNVKPAKAETAKVSEQFEEIDGVIERVAQRDPEAVAELKQYIAVQQTSHRGPMPSPADLKEYLSTQADLPERMMKMAEQSQQNKANHNDKILALKAREIELKKLDAININEAHKREINTQSLSLVLAFIIVLVCILGSFYLALVGKTKVALLIGGTTVVGIVGAFLKKPA